MWQYLLMAICSINRSFKDTMTDLFENIYEGVPKDVLHEAIMAQYAECEVTRYQALLSTWELERHERWKRIHSHCLNHFQAQNKDCQQKLELWRKWCIGMGMETDLTEQDIIWGILHEQTSSLNDMQDHYKCIEKIGIAMGVVLGSQQGDQAIPMKDPYASDPEVSSGSSEETSDDGPEVPHTSDPKILIQSNSSGHSE